MTTPLNELVACIQTTTIAGEFGTLLNYLQAHEEVLIQHMPQLDDAAQVLMPVVHTLGLVFILNVKGSAVPMSNASAVQIFVEQCRRLLLGCDPKQVQMVPKEFVAVCTKFSAACLAARTPLLAVRPLQVAALALQPTLSHFTPLHTEGLKVCVLAKVYSAAQPFLEQELLHVDLSGTLMTPRDLLLYHYYAGMAQVGLRRFRLAMASFMLCVSAPAHVLNAIMIEAYKKCLLCALIETGEMPRLPKYVSPAIARHIKTLAGYAEFAEAFASADVVKLRGVLEKHTTAFRTDQNLGLAKQCVPARMRRSIRLLTETYMTLSLAQIANIAGLDSEASAGHEIQQMILANEIHATIDESKNMITFHDKLERYESQATVATMEGTLRGALTLASCLSDLHSTLSTDRHYLARVTSPTGRLPQWEDEGLLSK